MAEHPFGVLFVCTGNQCRSPSAAALLRRLTVNLPVAVDSAGLLDAGSAPSPPETVAAAARLGLDLTGHRARPVTTEDLRAADLIVTFERAQVATLVVERDAPYERTFVLGELDRLLQGENTPPGEPTQRTRALVAKAHQSRAAGPSFVPGEEVADPIGRRAQVHEEALATLSDLVRRLVASLFGDREPAGD